MTLKRSFSRHTGSRDAAGLVRITKCSNSTSHEKSRESPSQLAPTCRSDGASSSSFASNTVRKSRPASFPSSPNLRTNSARRLFLLRSSSRLRISSSRLPSRASRAEELPSRFSCWARSSDRRLLEKRDSAVARPTWGLRGLFDLSGAELGASSSSASIFSCRKRTSWERPSSRATSRLVAPSRFTARTSTPSSTSSFATSSPAASSSHRTAPNSAVSSSLVLSPRLPGRLIARLLTHAMCPHRLARLSAVCPSPSS
eukprot:766120-Hanusia_phi.AAC.2